MSATTDSNIRAELAARLDLQISRETLETLTIAKLRELADARFGMTMPQKWSKTQIIDAILVQAAPSDDDEEPESETPESVTAGRFSSEAPNVPATPVEETPAEPVSEANEPEQLTPAISRDEVAAKLAAHRARLASEQTERASEAATRKRYQPWQPTEDELVKRAGRIAYNIGSLLFAQNRLRKEIKVLAQVLDAMGEIVDRDVLLKAKQKMIEQYAHNKQRACFPSAALDSPMKGEELREAVWSEIIAVGVPLQVAQLLGDQPLDTAIYFIDALTGAESDEEADGDE